MSEFKNIQELEDRLWRAADQLRANTGLTSQEYSRPVLGLIFLRYAEYRFEQAEARLAKKATSRRGSASMKAAIQAEGAMYVSEQVDEYNLGAYQAEQFFIELRNFVHELDEEDKRAGREGLSEEELAIFDLLSQEVELSEKERNKVKTIAKELLGMLKSVLVIDWRKKQRTKAEVHNLIEEVLDQLPDTYTDEIWPKAIEHVYLHIYDKYAGEGNSVYATKIN